MEGHLSPSPCSQDPSSLHPQGILFLGAHCSLRRSLSQKLAPPGKDISAEHATNDVSKVGDIVDVREGAGDEYISFPSHRQPGREEEKEQSMEQDAKVKKDQKYIRYPDTALDLVYCHRVMYTWSFLK